MTKININELTGAALDWAVSECEEIAWAEYDDLLFSGKATKVRPSEFLRDYDFNPDIFKPSTNWSQGGPIIERKGISIVQQGDTSDWVASVYNHNEDDWHLHTAGPTPLIAAMRCYVASKLGDEVEIPEELTK